MLKFVLEQALARFARRQRSRGAIKLFSRRLQFGTKRLGVRIARGRVFRSLWRWHVSYHPTIAHIGNGRLSS
ncbi:hypothetical protein [Sphingomonas sp. NFR15]|uniref:hypothetical protein n=1 Tax=Sphingomonas sp. NFR15 TaxID=1566282 RepID=UPI0015A14413|nr:hypothetical protein [Sphingomonas sp. NFR15]